MVIRSTTSPARLDVRHRELVSYDRCSASLPCCGSRAGASAVPEVAPPLMPMVPLVVTPSISPTAVSSPFASDVMLIPSASWLARLANVIPRVASLAWELSMTGTRSVPCKRGDQRQPGNVQIEVPARRDQPRARPCWRPGSCA